MSKEIQNWRNVFDTEHRHYGHVDIAGKVAAEANYPFMVWNGGIREYRDGRWEETDFYVSHQTGKIVKQ